MEESLPTWTDKKHSKLLRNLLISIRIFRLLKNVTAKNLQCHYTHLMFYVRRVGSYLACCYKVLERVNSQTEDVIIMAHVETLGILLSVVHNPNGSYMVDYLPSLGVEQITPAIIAPVTATKRKINCIIFLEKR